MSDSDQDDHKELVELYVYDLSGGIAAQFSEVLLGKRIEGVWHTSIVVAGLEHYFGGGINIAPAGQTHFGSPLKTIPLGYTSLPTDVREALLEDLRERFTAQSYSLLSFNCNTFSNEFSQLLIGKGIPQDILELPDLVMSTPFGEMMRPTLATLEQQLGSVQGPDVSAQQEVDAAIGGGMIEDYRFHSQLGSDERLALELAVAQEFDVLLANGMPEHEAQAVALERISNSRRGH